MQPSSTPCGDTRLDWMKVGIIGGFCASLFYPLLIFTPGAPRVMSVTLAALLGPAIGIASLGLHQLVRLGGRPVISALGAFHNVVAGALLTAMLLVQLALRDLAPDSIRDLVGIWLGLDVAWDVYIGLGTLLFACAMLRHPRFGWPFAVPGLGVAALLLVLNIATFPEPPGSAGLVDVGPLVGLWYLAVTIQLLRSLGWARGVLREAPGSGASGPLHG